MLRVGMIDYLNLYPILGGMLAGATATAHDYVYATPNHLNEALASGALDVAFISSVEYLKRHREYRIVGKYCVAAKSEVMSVSLFTRRSIPQLEGARIGLTSHSASSVALLKALCRHYWQVTPSFEPLSGSPDDYDAYLLIGDPCLKRARPPGWMEVDLAAAWHRETGLPFTFAVLAARKESLKDKRGAYLSFLEELRLSALWAHHHPFSLITLARQKCSLSSALLARYFSKLHYQMGPEEVQGLSLFYNLVFQRKEIAC